MWNVERKMCENCIPGAFMMFAVDLRRWSALREYNLYGHTVFTGFVLGVQIEGSITSSDSSRTTI